MTTHPRLRDRLSCGTLDRPQRWITIITAAAIACASHSVFARDTPLEPTGPQIRTAAGVTSTFGFRDLVLDDGWSPWSRVSLSYLGFSVSAWGTARAQSPRSAECSEMFAAYGRKLPFVDFHVGAARSVTHIGQIGPMTAARFVAATNVSDTWLAEMAIDRSVRGDRTLITAAFTRSVLHRRQWTVDARASGTWWKDPTDRVNGWSVRLLGSRPIGAATRLVPYFGYTSTARPDSSRGRMVAGISVAFQ